LSEIEVTNGTAYDGDTLVDADGNTGRLVFHCGKPHLDLEVKMNGVGLYLKVDPKDYRVVKEDEYLYQ